MAEINSTNVKRERHLSRRTVKKSTRPDLTPMVDLGFLLITFFIFTTVLSAPKSVKIRMPSDTGVSDVQVNRLLTFIADSNGVCYSYEARNPQGTLTTHNYRQPESIRQTIIAKKAALKEAYPGNSYAIVSLKFLPGATYGAFTALFDEVKINNISYYNLDKVREAEKELIAASPL